MWLGLLLAFVFDVFWTTRRPRRNVAHAALVLLESARPRLSGFAECHGVLRMQVAVVASQPPVSEKLPLSMLYEENPQSGVEAVKLEKFATAPDSTLKSKMNCRVIFGDPIVPVSPLI